MEVEEDYDKIATAKIMGSRYFYPIIVEGPKDYLHQGKDNEGQNKNLRRPATRLQQAKRHDS